MIRNQYTFGRPLADTERELLVRLIGWRRGSRVTTDESGAVVGCIAHPDDVAEFKKESRKLRCAKDSRAVKIAPVLVRQEQDDPEPQESEPFDPFDPQWEPDAPDPLEMPERNG